MSLPPLPEPEYWRVRRHDAPDYWILFMHKPVDALRDPEREVQPLLTADQMHAYAAAARLAALEEAAQVAESWATEETATTCANVAAAIRSLAIHVPPTCTENREK